MLRILKLTMTMAFYTAALQLLSQGTIRGTVIDETTGEGLPGANITNQQQMTGTATGPDGTFVLELVPGSHTIKVSMIGYSPATLETEVFDGIDNDLGRVYLTPEVIGLEEISVISSIAVDRRSPLTVSTIRASEIETRLGDEPLPSVMKAVPGVYATRTGGGSGDAAVNIRGFKQENITLLLNGIPISSVENGLVYWNNWLGLSDVTERIQVQRGLGASPAAMNSIGGTINIITRTAGDEEGGTMDFSVSDYGNMKAGFSYNTGKLENGLAVSLMGSHIRGPGYVDATYVRAWGYFLSISKEFNDRHKLVFIGLGSPERHGQRNFMLSKEETRRYGLKYNKDWGSYNGEVNNSSENFYHKPHLSLSHYWNISKRTFLATAAYFSYGHGGGKWSDSFMTGLGIGDYRNPSGQIDWAAIYENNSSHTDTFTLATGKKVTGFSKNIQTDFLASHVWTGLISTMDHQFSETLSLSAGIHYRYFRSVLQQKVRDLLGGDFYIDDYAWSLSGVAGREQVKNTGDIVKVDNGALIHYVNLFAQAEHAIGRWRSFLAASLSQNWYKRVDHYNYVDDPWSEGIALAGFDLKGGVNFNINENHHLYANAGYFSRVPYYKFVFGNFTNMISGSLSNEKVSSVEAGYGFSQKSSRLRLNAYYTYWEDKAFLANEYNQFLDPVLIRGLDAEHAGLELEASQRINRNISIAAMVSVGKWQWKNDVQAEVYDNNNVLKDTVNVFADGLYVGDAPQLQVGLKGEYQFLDRFTLGLSWIYYDRLYADFNPVNRNDPSDREQSYRLPSYALLDGHFTVNFTIFGQAAAARLNVMNMLDSEHIMRGLDGADHSIGTFRGFWGFGRTVNVGMRLAF